MTRRRFPLRPGRRTGPPAGLPADPPAAPDGGPSPAAEEPGAARPESGWALAAWILDDDERVERLVLVVGALSFPAVLLAYVLLVHPAGGGPDATGRAVLRMVAYPLGASLLFLLTVWIRRRRRKRAARAAARETAEGHQHRSGRATGRSL